MQTLAEMCNFSANCKCQKESFGWGIYGVPPSEDLRSVFNQPDFLAPVETGGVQLESSY